MNSDGIEYTIKAIETKFRGFTFRSRLEARWAAMFELLGWNWDYEPVDFNGWIPDFVIYGKEPVYVEVKPVVELPKLVAERMSSSGCSSEMLILGQSCLIPRPDAISWSPFFGWLADRNDCIEGEWEFNDAVFGRWADGRGMIGFCSETQSFRDRISGGYDGGCHGSGEVSHEEIKILWGSAHTATRWMK